jgi:hypothetical protein
MDIRKSIKVGQIYFDYISSASPQTRFAFKECYFIFLLRYSIYSVFIVNASGSLINVTI